VSEQTYALDIGLCNVGFVKFLNIFSGAYLRRSSSFLITHSTPDRLHGVHSLSPGGTTQRIRRSRHVTHATEALWRGFVALSFIELVSTGVWLDSPRLDDGSPS
jgi:hypothetical protein